eukprot:scaffold22660_cov127-Cylindrotheca_fusiformis.AAC.9
MNLIVKSKCISHLYQAGSVFTGAMKGSRVLQFNDTQCNFEIVSLSRNYHVIVKGSEGLPPRKTGVRRLPPVGSKGQSPCGLRG